MKGAERGREREREREKERLRRERIVRLTIASSQLLIGADKTNSRIGGDLLYY